MNKILYHTVTQQFLPHPGTETIPGLVPEIEVYDLVVEARPPFDPSVSVLEEVNTADHLNKRLTRSWRVVARIPLVKTWPTLTEFWQEFTAEEKLAILNSTDPQVKLLYSDMSHWRYNFRADDSRVTGGLGLLVSLGILTAARSDEIVSPSA